MYISIVNDSITILLVYWITDENRLLVRRVPNLVKIPTVALSLNARVSFGSRLSGDPSAQSTRDPSAVPPTRLKTAMFVVTHPTDSYISRALMQMIRVSTNTPTMIEKTPQNKLNMVE